VTSIVPLPSRCGVVICHLLFAALPACSGDAGALKQVLAFPVSLDFETSVVKRASAQVDHLVTTPPTGSASTIPVFYEAGASEDRWARIGEDPIAPGNRVLQFGVKNAAASGAQAGWTKGRVEMRVLFDEPRTALTGRVRLFLHQDLASYRSYPAENLWFTISELWMGKQADDDHFRITVGIGKKAGVGQPLAFLVHGDTRVGGTLNHEEWSTVWAEMNERYEIPFGTWIELRFRYRMGDAQSGSFVLEARSGSEVDFTTVANVTNWTYSPTAPAPMPLKLWNPVKLYTSSAIIDHVRANGGVVQLSWDDLAIE
jgi:hypothetical protein